MAIKNTSEYMTTRAELDKPPILPVNSDSQPIVVGKVNADTYNTPNSGRFADYDVYYQDTDINSKFFRITRMPSVFASGKNFFLITGTSLLVTNTVVAVEVLDVNGNQLQINIPDILINGTDRVVVVNVKSDDYYGDAIITILGEAKDVPSSWKGVYNVKWQKKVLVNPTIDNEDDVIFVKNPTITFDEIYDEIGYISKVNYDKTIYNQGLMYSKIAWEKLSPLMEYRLYLQNGVSPSTNGNFDTLDAWYTGSSYVDHAYVSSNKLYISQSYGLFGITLGVTQSFAMEANKIYTLTANLESESDLGGSVASVMIYSGSNLLLYLYATSSVTLTGEFSSPIGMSASIELTGQAFALQTVWSNVYIQDLISGSYGNGFTKEMEGGYLYISGSDMTIYPRTSEYETGSYGTYISKVVNSNMAIANNSYQAKQIRNKLYDRVQFISASYELNYGKKQLIGNPNVKNSYLKLKLRNLETYVGSVKYVDLYKNPGNTYIGRYPIVAHDMLVSGSVFTSSVDFTNNWSFISSGTYINPRRLPAEQTLAVD